MRGIESENLSLSGVTLRYLNQIHEDQYFEGICDLCKYFALESV